MEGHGRRRRRCSDDGAAAVEFALVVPLLCYILFAIIGYGYMLSFRQGLSQAAAEGARDAAVAPPGRTDAERETDALASLNESLGSYDVTCTGGNLIRSSTDVGDCDVSIGTCPESGDRCVTVTVDYHYADHAIVPVPGLGIVLPDHLGYTSVAEVS
jgi:Flp pilus assembly protein TadG